MIPGITEVNFPSYATLNNATISFAEMGDRSITTQVRIDGDVVPSFDGWALKFRGEKFILPIRDPQAAKDNTTRNSIIDLTFYSWPIYQMKRHFFFETTTTATGTVMADKYQATVTLSLVNFCALLNRVLDYYYGGKIYVDLNPDVPYSSETAMVEMDYAYIWDVVQKTYELYSVRWYIAYDEEEDKYAIKIGYPSPEIDDHQFEYGYEGGLLRFERQVQDDNVNNILLGRGGTKNLPYRYFKRIDPNNEEWAADPDAIPELTNVYFDRIRDINFRWYVRGWMTNPNRDPSWENAGYVYPSYDYSEIPIENQFAYSKGATDAKFDPVEYVKDDDSITRYGERWGHLDDNDDIYPTIQGIMWGGSRVDTVIDVGEIGTDDVQAAAAGSAEIVNISGVTSQVDDVPANGSITRTIRGGLFVVPEGKTANLLHNGWFVKAELSRSQALEVVYSDQCSVRVFDSTDDSEVSAQGIPAGTYYYVLYMVVTNNNYTAVGNVTYGNNGLYLQLSETAVSDGWKPTFDIWVRNIFDSQQGVGETDDDYSLRVWRQILGDRLGNEAKVVFSDGFMSISEDYEFLIVSYPVVDRSKSLAGVQSEWKITLQKSDAEYEATGLYIPNSKTGGSPVAGDHIFFIGIDMPTMYVIEAEKALNKYKRSGLTDIAEIFPTWVVQLDKVRMDDEYNEEQEKLINKMDAGTKVTIRDPRFTGGLPLVLYIRSVTFSWIDGTVVLPDTEVVLTDKIEGVQNPVAQLQGQIDIVKATYAKIDSLSSASIEAARPMFLAKTGEEQTSLSPTKFAALVSSEDFKQGGLGGQGWGLYRDGSPLYDNVDDAYDFGYESDTAPSEEDPSDNEEDDDEEEDDATVNPSSAARSGSLATLEVDRLIVRHDMLVNNIVVNQIAYIGGKQIISAAAIECVQVVEDPDGYRCYFDQKQGSVKNLFVVNDVAMGQIFTAEGIQLRFYKRLVTETGLDYIKLSKTNQYGGGIPKKGDVIVQYGNTQYEDRRYVIIRDVIGGGYEQMLSDLDNVNSSGVEYYFAGMNSIAQGGTVALRDVNENQLQDSATKDLHVLGGARPRFFVGTQESYIEFLEKEKTFYVHGALVQSPSGITFPVPCFCGEYSANEWYYYGDMVTYLGQSWIHIGKNRTKGTVPSSGQVWQLYTEKGGSIYRLDLTNENASINADANGSILPGAVRPSCTAKLYYGEDAVSGASYSLSTPDAQNVVGLSINSGTGVLTFNSGNAGTPFSFDGNAVEITITATKDSITRTATMTVSKSYPGADGTPATSYWLVLSSDKVSVDPNAATPVADPSSVTPTAMLQIGEQAPRIAVLADNLTIKYAYDSESQTTIVSGTAHTILLKNASTQAIHRTLHFYLYKSGVTDPIDQEGVPILYDGQDGETPVVADLDNEMDAIGVGSNGMLETAISASDALVTHFSMFFGTERLPFKRSNGDVASDAIIISGLPTGMVATKTFSKNPSTSANENYATIKFTAPNVDPDTSSTWIDLTDGRYPITITGKCTTPGGAEVERTLTYTLMGVRDGADGETYILVPDANEVQKTYTYSGDVATAVIAPTHIKCDAKTSSGNDLESDYSIYYRLNASSVYLLYKKQTSGIVTYGSASLQTDGIPTSEMTSRITLYLFLDDTPGNYADYVDIETIPLVSDGLKGAAGGQGERGRMMRGISTWAEDGYEGSGSYEGKDDADDGEWYDIVMYDDLFYMCIYSENPNTQKTAAGTELTHNPSANLVEDGGCWELMNNYENIATKALAASQALINQLSADNAFIRELATKQAMIENLRVKELHTEDDQVNIADNHISVADNTIKIHSDDLSDINGDSGSTIGTQTVSLTGGAGSAQIDVKVLGQTGSSDNSISIVSANNRVSVPAILVSASISPVLHEYRYHNFVVALYAVSGSTYVQLVTPASYEGVQSLSTTIPAFVTTLGVGTWKIVCRVSVDFISATDGQQMAVSTTMGSAQSSLTVEYPVASAMTELAGNGFRTIWSDAQHASQGVEVTAAGGPQVIHDGDSYMMVGGDGVRIIKLVLPGESYPSDANMLDGAIYIKLNQAVS